MQVKTLIIIEVEHNDSVKPEDVLKALKFETMSMSDLGREPEISIISLEHWSTEKIFPPDTPEYLVWRKAVSDICTKDYGDPFGQDPTSKCGEDHWRELYHAGKTAMQAARPFKV